jgi:hypothetical protein
MAAYGINGYFSDAITDNTSIALKGASMKDGTRNDNACFRNFPRPYNSIACCTSNFPKIPCKKYY